MIVPHTNGLRFVFTLELRLLLAADADPLLILRNLLAGERRYNEKLRLALHFLHRQ